ncbi:hypothetical protein [Novosphingobium sp. JCM 18896]|uniref:hypothetical protein n=1 Tax=Novosphingobium sp. JCM 18896 TaxID=2989731 RepID=UPI00222352D5|nr:hypothetical protein [Novosphingobium sp. JCM 18896]
MSHRGWRAGALVWALALAWLPSVASANSRTSDFAALDLLDTPNEIQADMDSDAAPLRLSTLAMRTYRPIPAERAAANWTFGETAAPAIGGGWREDATLVRFELTGKRRLGGHVFAATIGGVDLGRGNLGPSNLGGVPATANFATGLGPIRQPIPLSGDVIDYVQPRYGHPLLDFAPGAFKRPGFYGKLAWTAPVPVRAELMHFDSNADPMVAGGDREWGRRTLFDALGVVAELDRDWELRAQALAGRTRQGDRTGGDNWIDMRFHAAYGMVTRRFARTALSARVDLYQTRNAGSAGLADDEAGWAVTLAARRQIGPQLAALVEVLHAECDGEARLRPAGAFAGRRSQVMMAMRAHW